MQANTRGKIWGLMLLAGALLLWPGGVTAAPGTVGAATPEQAVSTLLEPFYLPAADSPCNAARGQFTACPMTARFAERVAQATENGNIIIRAQYPPLSLTIKPMHDDGQIAHVAAVFDSRVSSYSITFTTVKRADGWLVDDSFCTAQPGSSIYNTPTGPCPLDTRGPSMPGMPATGGGTLRTAPVVPLILGALLALVTGLLTRAAASRRHAR